MEPAPPQPPQPVDPVTGGGHFIGDDQKAAVNSPPELTQTKEVISWKGSCNLRRPQPRGDPSHGGHFIDNGQAASISHPPNLGRMTTDHGLELNPK